MAYWVGGCLASLLAGWWVGGGSSGLLTVWVVVVDCYYLKKIVAAGWADGLAAC